MTAFALTRISEPDEIARVRASAAELEAFCRDAAIVIGGRWRYLQAFQAALGEPSDAPATRMRSAVYQALDAELAGMNAVADENARTFAAIVHALDVGAAVLVPGTWNEQLIFAVGNTDKIRALQPGLGVWPMVLAAVKWAAGMVVPAGVFYLADLYLSTEETKADAAATLAATEARLAALAEEVAKADPAAGARLAHAITQAQIAASKPEPTWMDRILGFGSDVASSTTGTLLAIGALWLLTRKRAA